VYKYGAVDEIDYRYGRDNVLYMFQPPSFLKQDCLIPTVLISEILWASAFVY